MITAEELLERILILTTVNSTLIHALISIEAEEDIGPKQIKQLATGVQAVRDSVKQALMDSRNNNASSGSSFVDDTIQVILTHLGRIEKALDSLAMSRETKPTKADVKTVTEPIATARRLVTEATADLAGLTGKPFQRRLSIHDPEKLLPPIQQLLDKYSTRSHLLLPNFWHEACMELFRYSEPREVILEVTRIAGRAFFDLIRRFLAEAPCAGLLQEIARKGTIGIDLINSEKNQIIANAREFYDQLANALKTGSIKNSTAETKRTLQSFDWGPVDAEKRVVGVIHRSAKELADSAADGKGLTKNERIIMAELSRYICSLSTTIHGLPRFNQLFTDMKV